MEMTEQAAVKAAIKAMTGAFAAGDVPGVMQAYWPGAVVVAAPGRPVSGEAALAAMFSDFVSSGFSFTPGRQEVVLAADTALHLMAWTSPGADGTLLSALSVAVLRRSASGEWRMVIDHPFGDGVLSQG